MSNNHPSIETISRNYFSSINKDFQNIPAIHFCDNAKDANECLQLVLDGIKTATATSLWEFELLKEPLPQVGDLYVVTDWDKVGHCVIETSNITHLKFRDIEQQHALLEGEGDKSLAHWQEVHRAYYTRQFEGTQYRFNEDMIIVFEEFKVVYQ